MHGHRWQRCYGLLKLKGEGSRQHEAAGVRVETLTRGSLAPHARLFSDHGEGKDCSSRR